MGLLDSISNLIPNLSEKGQEQISSGVDLTLGAGVHLARTAVIESLSFIPGIGNYFLAGKTLWSGFKGNSKETIQGLESLLQLFPLLGSPLQVLEGAYSLVFKESFNTKEETSASQALLQIAFGVFGLACDLRGWKTSRLSLSEYFNDQAARLWGPRFLLKPLADRIPVLPGRQLAGTPGLTENDLTLEAEEVLERPLNIFMAAHSERGSKSGPQWRLDHVNFDEPELGSAIPEILDGTTRVKIADSTLRKKAHDLAKYITAGLKRVWSEKGMSVVVKDEREAERILSSQLSRLAPVSDPPLAVVYDHLALNVGAVIKDQSHYARKTPFLEAAEPLLYGPLIDRAYWGRRSGVGIDKEGNRLIKPIPKDFYPHLPDSFSLAESHYHMKPYFGVDLGLYYREPCIFEGREARLPLRVLSIGYRRIKGGYVLENIQGHAKLREYKRVGARGNLLDTAQRVFEQDMRGQFLDIVMKYLRHSDPVGPIFMRYPYDMDAIPWRLKLFKAPDAVTGFERVNVGEALQRTPREEIPELIARLTQHLSQDRATILKAQWGPDNTVHEFPDWQEGIQALPRIWRGLFELADRKGFVLEDPHSSLLVYRGK